jgi:hypothetical protein
VPLALFLNSYDSRRILRIIPQVSGSLNFVLTWQGAHSAIRAGKRCPKAVKLVNASSTWQTSHFAGI